MKQTKEQQVCTNNLKDAIEKYLEVYQREGKPSDGCLLTSFVIIAESLSLSTDDTKADMEHHMVITDHDERLSTATGLLHIGLDIICADSDD